MRPQKRDNQFIGYSFFYSPNRFSKQDIEYYYHISTIPIRTGFASPLQDTDFAVQNPTLLGEHPLIPCTPLIAAA